MARTDHCHYCDKDAQYLQPEKDTGKIISVCIDHFIYRYMG